MANGPEQTGKGITADLFDVTTACRLLAALG